MEDLLREVPSAVRDARARPRVAMAITVATQRDHAALPTLVRELHALAGEAGLLGLHDVVPLARDCELKAKALQASRGDDATRTARGAGPADRGGRSARGRTPWLVLTRLAALRGPPRAVLR